MLQNHTDRHAKKELKKHIRGVRPIEREVEKRNNAEAEAIRGYCLAVRSALTEDGRPPLEAPGLKLYQRIAAIGASLTRISEKGGLPRELERMQSFITKGLTETASLWSDVEQGYAWVHRAAHILSNEEKLSAAQVRHAYERLLAEMEQAPPSSDALITMLSTFCKVTASYWPGLFHCYDLADLPRTNNELEHYLARYAIMNDERPGESRRLQVWSSVELCGWSHPLLPICMPFLAQSFAHQTLPNGVPCKAN